MLSLLDRRILITRTRTQASALATLLQSLGAIPILIPAIELRPPASYCALDAALTTLRAFDLVVFTSANAVHAFAERARQLQLPPHPRRVAVIGPATAAAVHASTIAPDDPDLLMPSAYIAESLAAFLEPHAAGASILIPRAALAREVLPEALTAAGASVTLVDTYQTVVPRASVEQLTALFRSLPPAAITFTSASTAHNLAALLTEAKLTIPNGTVLASIGPITSDAMREHGFTPAVEAGEATIASLVQILTRYFESRGLPADA